jgi:hypothetical protein
MEENWISIRGLDSAIRVERSMVDLGNRELADKVKIGFGLAVIAW